MDFTRFSVAESRKYLQSKLKYNKYLHETVKFCVSLRIIEVLLYFIFLIKIYNLYNIYFLFLGFFFQL